MTEKCGFMTWTLPKQDIFLSRLMEIMYTKTANCSCLNTLLYFTTYTFPIFECICLLIQRKKNIANRFLTFYVKKPNIFFFELFFINFTFPRVVKYILLKPVRPLTLKWLWSIVRTFFVTLRR